MADHFFVLCGKRNLGFWVENLGNQCVLYSSVIPTQLQLVLLVYIIHNYCTYYSIPISYKPHKRVFHSQIKRLFKSILLNSPVLPSSVCKMYLQQDNNPKYFSLVFCLCPCGTGPCFLFLIVAQCLCVWLTFDVTHECFSSGIQM